MDEQLWRFPGWRARTKHKFADLDNLTPLCGVGLKRNMPGREWFCTRTPQESARWETLSECRLCTRIEDGRRRELVVSREVGSEKVGR